jgi:hypothetical protein
MMRATSILRRRGRRALLRVLKRHRPDPHLNVRLEGLGLESGGFRVWGPGLMVKLLKGFMVDRLKKLRVQR